MPHNDHFPHNFTVETDDEVYGMVYLIDRDLNDFAQKYDSDPDYLARTEDLLAERVRLAVKVANRWTLDELRDLAAGKELE